MDVWACRFKGRNTTYLCFHDFKESLKFLKHFLFWWRFTKSADLSWASIGPWPSRRKCWVKTPPPCTHTRIGTPWKAPKIEGGVERALSSGAEEPLPWNQKKGQSHKCHVPIRHAWRSSTRQTGYTLASIGQPLQHTTSRPTDRPINFLKPILRFKVRHLIKNIIIQPLPEGYEILRRIWRTNCQSRQRFHALSVRMNNLILILSHQDNTVPTEKIMKTTTMSFRTFFQPLHNLFVRRRAFQEHDERFPHLAIRNTLPKAHFCDRTIQICWRRWEINPQPPTEGDEAPGSPPHNHSKESNC